MASTTRLAVVCVLLIWNVNNLECLNVTCSNQIGLHPYRRMNTCYIKRIDRPLQPTEQLTFIQSYGSPDQIKTLDISIANPNEPGIDRIPTEAFTWFKHLESLRVNSKVTTISAHDFHLSPNLTELIISDQLEMIERGIFPANNKLEFLSFESNRIATIRPFAFEQLKRLFSLKLQRNLIKAIQRHTFSGLKSLHVLNLNENEISTIENGAFLHFDQLQFLHLQQNRLEFLHDDIFQGLTSLIDISLSKNRLHHINKSLQLLTNIKKIDLNYNSIVDLNLNQFVTFPKLVDLRLINSGFTFQTDQDVRPNATSSVLEYLYLDNNNLSNPLELLALSHFRELRELSLDDNLYKTFDLGGKRIKEILPKLRFLSLEGNDIDPSVLRPINDELHFQTSTINPI